MLITRISRDTFIGNGNGMDENGEKRVILWPRINISFLFNSPTGIIKGEAA